MATIRLPQAQRPLFERLVSVTVEVRKLSGDGDSCGSGVVLTPGGLIVTAWHVITRSRVVRVRRLRLEKRSWRISAEGHYLADVVWRDKRADLAVLKLRKPPIDLAVATLGDSDDLKVDEAVFRVGRDPVPLATGYVTLISSYNRLPEFTASMPTAPGSSGGPIFDAEGDLVGICLRYQADEKLPPQAHALPVNDVKRRLFWRAEVKQYLPD